MARKTFLTEDQLASEAQQLRPPSVAPNGNLKQKIRFYNQEYSNWLLQCVTQTFARSVDIQKLRPLLLGSGASGGLCLKSDLDFIFLGDQQIVETFTQEILSLGIKLRYRVPEDYLNLRVGVEGVDALALLQGQALREQDQGYLETQKALIETDKKFKQKLLKIILNDQKLRRLRYGDVESLLEPNLKYGKGGLRDIQQARQLILLFSEKFKSEKHAQEIFKYYFDFFTTIRQKLHSLGLYDTLAAGHQAEIAQWMGYKDSRTFMREIQKGLSRVSFYSQWVVEWALTTDAQIQKLNKVKIKSLKQAASFLKKDSSLKHSRILRAQMDDIFRKNKPRSKDVGWFLQDVLSVKVAPQYLRAAFGSRLIDKMFPNVKRLFGWVQHDQYHRYTADAHLMQACLQVKQFYRKPSCFHALAKYAKQLSANDWKVISLAAFYHDQAKGLSGQHEIKIIKFIREDFKKFGYGQRILLQVEWLVKNHLEVSLAAFRKNVNSDRTIAELIDKGIAGENLLRLACFTAIDIAATNPEAWNEWKSKLILKLVEVLNSQRSQTQESLIRLCRAKKVKWEELPFYQMDEQLLELVPARVLFNDYLQLKKGFQVYSGSKNNFWVSFYNPQDQAGLFRKVSSALMGAGLNIRHAFIHTIPGVGVYDWFEVTSSKSSIAIQKALSWSEQQGEVASRVVEFREIELISEQDTEWIILFRAKDQTGLLHRAAEILTQEGLNIKWAKVHTWGRQIEDIFAVQPPLKMNGQELLERLKRHLYLTHK